MSSSAFTIEDAPQSPPEQTSQFTIEDAPKALPPSTIGPQRYRDLATGEDTEASRNPFSSYFEQAENLTQEGAKAHPIQNFIGQTVKRARNFGSMLATEGGILFAGPGELAEGAAIPLKPIEAPASSLTPSTAAIEPYRFQGEVAEPAPLGGPRPVPRATVVPSRELPPAGSIQAAQSSLEQPKSMLEAQGGKLPAERGVALTPTSAPPIPVSAPAEPPAPLAGPQRPTPTTPTRTLLNRLGSQIEQATGFNPNAAIYPRAGSVGAKGVTDIPNDIVAGPRIATPSRDETLLETMKNSVPGSNPLEKGIPLKEQPEPPARTPAQVPEQTVHPQDRQFIHVNGGEAFARTVGQPGLRNDLLDLEGEQLREVLRKSGEDMTHIKKIGNPISKAPKGGRFADPDTITRQEAFEMLFENGYTPEQIIREAPPRSKPAPHRVPFGPARIQ